MVRGRYGGVGEKKRREHEDPKRHAERKKREIATEEALHRKSFSVVKKEQENLFNRKTGRLPSTLSGEGQSSLRY